MDKKKEGFYFLDFWIRKSFFIDLQIWRAFLYGNKP